MTGPLRTLSTYLFVTDIDASLQFYRALGMRVERVSDAFGRALIGDEVVFELGTADLTSSYDPRYVPPDEISKGTLNFELESSAAVDETFEQLIESGYRGHLPPIVALWQARFAIVLDPDGNQVGLHGPRSLEEDRERESAGA